MVIVPVGCTRVSDLSQTWRCRQQRKQMGGEACACVPRTLGYFLCHSGGKVNTARPSTRQSCMRTRLRATSGAAEYGQAGAIRSDDIKAEFRPWPNGGGLVHSTADVHPSAVSSFPIGFLFLSFSLNPSLWLPNRCANAPVPA